SAEGGMASALASWRETMWYSLSAAGSGISDSARRSTGVNALGSRLRDGTSVLPLFHDEQEPGTAFFTHDAALLQLVFGPHDVVDRVGFGGHVVDGVLQGHVFSRQLLHLVVEGGDRFLLIVDHALEVLNRRGEFVFQAVGERGEFPHPLLGLLQLRLDL